MIEILNKARRILTRHRHCFAQSDVDLLLAALLDAGRQLDYAGIKPVVNLRLVEGGKR